MNWWWLLAVPAVASLAALALVILYGVLSQRMHSKPPFARESQERRLPHDPNH